MRAKFIVAIVAMSLLVAVFGTSGSDSPQAIAGVYNLVEVNDSELPAATWVKQKGGRECKTETLSGTMMLDSQGKWAALIEEREVCADDSEEGATITVGSSIITGSYKVSGKDIEFYDEIGGTDSATLKEDILRLTVIGVAALEGQTAVYVLHRVK